MNTGNLRRTARAIEDHPDWYDQGEWLNDCGTPACVAGHAVYVAGGEFRPEGPEGPEEPNGLICRAADGRVLPIRDYAAEILGLNPRQAGVMFAAVPQDTWGQKFTPTAAEAVAMLTEAADTGRVVWRQAAGSLPA